MVFCYQNYSDLLWKKIVLVIEKNFWNSRLKAENLQTFEITRTIFLNKERAEQFSKPNSNLFLFGTLEQLEFKSDKIIGI